MKYAVCISSFLFPEFVALNIVQARLVFGNNTPILVSDDLSNGSAQIENVAAQYGCSYTCSKARRSHFAGDLQSVLNGLTFAESIKADAMVKISFRLVLLDPVLRDVFTNHFNTGAVMMVPKKIYPAQLIRRESLTFAQLPLLTDIILLKTGATSPKELIEIYRHKQQTETVKWKSLVESLFCDMHAKFGDKSKLLDELSFHEPGKPHRFLRKAQNNRMEYLDLARKHGIQGEFDCREWVSILGVNYHPHPVVA